jgi:hypothetical protein
MERFPSYLQTAQLFAMNDLSQTITDVPWIGLIPVLLLVMVGLLLWVAGRKVLPVCLAAIGLMIGAGVGWVIGDSITTGVAPWAVAALGAVVFALIGALAYRLAVMAALAAVFGLVAPLSVLTVNDLRMQQSGSISESMRTRVEEFKSVLQQHEETLDQAAEEKSDVEQDLEKQLGLSEKGQSNLADVRSVVERLIDGGKELWKKAPEKLQPVLAATAILGAFVGIIIGLLMPKLAAAVVTSMGGSALWLSGGHVLLTRLGGGDAAWLPSTCTHWLVVWLITSCVGFGLQWFFRGKRAAPADKPA